MMAAMPGDPSGASVLAGPASFLTSLAGNAFGALGRAASAPNVSSATSGGFGNGLDASGWAVNFRGQQNATSTPSRSYSTAQPVVQPMQDWTGLPFVGPSAAMQAAGGSNWMWWAVGGLGLLAIWRLKK